MVCQILDFAKSSSRVYFSIEVNWAKSAARFCRWVAARVTHMPCNFNLAKITKLLVTQQPLKLEKKLAQIWNP